MFFCYLHTQWCPHAQNLLRSGGDFMPLWLVGCFVLFYGVSTLFGGACGVMVIVIGNGHGDTSSYRGRERLHFHIALIPLGKGMNPIILPPAMGK